MPLTGGMGGAVGDGARVEPVGGRPGGGHQPPVTDPGECPGVGGEVRVHGGPVRGGQARGLAHQQGGAPFVQLPGLECGEGVRHFGHEGFGQAQEPAAFGRGFAPGEGDLRAGPGPEPLRGDSRGSLLAALEQIKSHGEPGLFGGQGGFPVLQFPDPVDDPGTVHGARTVPAGQQVGGG